MSHRLSHQNITHNVLVYNKHKNNDKHKELIFIADALHDYVIYIYYSKLLYNIMLENEEVCDNTIYSSSEASGVNHIIHRRLR